MVEEIRLPHIPAICPNAVYGLRDIVPTQSGSVTDVERIFLLQRFDLPWEEEVVSTIVETAKVVLQAGKEFVPAQLHGGFTDLEAAVVLTYHKQPKLVEDLVARPDHQYELGQCTPAPPQKGRTDRDRYFLVREGIVPLAALECGVSDSTFRDPQLYRTLLREDDLKRRNFGEEWQLRLLLEPNGLPTWARLGPLVEDNTTSSRTITVAGTFDYSSVRHFIDQLYEASPTVEQLATVPDESQNSLLNSCLYAFGKFSRNTASRELRDKQLGGGEKQWIF